MSTLLILSNTERREFESEPILTLREQQYFFNIPASLLIDINSVKNKVLITLLWGYFKATNLFYSSLNQKSNIKFVSDLYAYQTEDLDFSITSSYRYREIIKEYLEVNRYTNKINHILQKEADNLAKNFVSSKKIFFSLIYLSKKLNIEMPKYTELTRIIQSALNTQKKDILDKLEVLQKDERLKALDEFLEKDKVSKNRYKIAYFRKLEHSTAKNQMLLSLRKFYTIKSKYDSLEEILNTIGMTQKIAQYYSKWTQKSQVFQIKRKKDIESNFLLLAFIKYQYLIRNDNLIDRFISTVQSAKNSSLRAQKDFSFELEPKKNRVLECSL